jgi:hypothetical protein
VPRQEVCSEFNPLWGNQWKLLSKGVDECGMCFKKMDSMEWIRVGKE